VVKVAGTWGSFARLLACYISEKLKRPILYICPHIDDADNAADDLRTFGAGQVMPLPAWEGEEAIADATDEIRAERLKVALRLSTATNCLSSLHRYKPFASRTEAADITDTKLAVRQMAISAWKKQVSGSPITALSGRPRGPSGPAPLGGIVDIYAPLTTDRTEADQQHETRQQQTAEAIRVDFFGDTVESIREINLDTQLSSRQLKKVRIISAVGGASEEERELFLNLLPKETIVVLEDPTDIRKSPTFYRAAEQSDRLYRWMDIYEAQGRFTQLHYQQVAADADSIKSISRYPAISRAKQLP
jgi:transcription-repair coupling factor (superfamily II helicase)